METKPNRKPNRLKEWDYSQPWWYHITICTQNRESWLGEIKKGKMYLNEAGNIACQCYQDLVDHYQCRLDEWVVMPNHVHGIIEINDIPIAVGNGLKPFPTQDHPKIHGLSEIIRGFKTFSSRFIHEAGLSEFKWQKSFYDHIIRSEKSLNAIREYIRYNPMRWMDDDYFGD